MHSLATRQVHLDFHTSEHIPGIGAAFDAEAFGDTFAAARVNSATVFARCHHGLLYYPSAKFPERVHPHLAVPDLLMQQVEALHKRGIKAPLYTSVQWDYYAATRHPEWLVRNRDGSHHGYAFTEAGFYQTLCVNTGYTDFLKAHVAELCALFDGKADGIFFDIVAPKACLCSRCRADMQRLGIDMTDDNAVWRHGKDVMDRFKLDMSAFVESVNPGGTVFYNAGHVAPETKASSAAYTHFELESLPSGAWGYLHFPLSARYARNLGKDCLGMTGKFHTEWGDFHSYKNTAALEFECFRMLSYGFACSIGDQLEPYGKLNKATYELIGEVYTQVEAYEPWARPSVPLRELAVLTDEPKTGDSATSEAVKGAGQMLEELGLQFDIVDIEMDFAPYKALIIPEGIVCTAEEQAKLDAYAANGGAILACGAAALTAQGQAPSCYGADTTGTETVYPSFLVAEGLLAGGLADNAEYVIYQPGQTLVPRAAQVILQKRLPYFARTGAHFCSHRYTPSDKGAAYPAAVHSGNVIWFSHPLFAQYRVNAPLWCKKLVSNALDILIPDRLVRHNGPSTLSVQILHQPDKRRYCLHLLSYIPVRKSDTIDIIEERTKAHDVTLHLNLPETVMAARLVPDGTALPIVNGSVTLPVIDGYAVVEAVY